MAAATLVSPAAAYHSNPPGPPPYSHSRPSIPAMMAGPEPRRSPIDGDASKRQSLPSLSEVFSGAKNGPYSPSTSASGSAGQGLVQQPAPPPPPPPSSSFATSGPSRIDSGLEARSAAADDRHFRYPRSEPAQGPPGAAFTYGEHREMSKPPDPPQRNGHHYAAASAAPPPPPPPPPPMSSYAQQGQLPPSQYPLPQGPISPRHMGPPGAYDRQRLLHSDEDYGSQRRFETSTLNRHLDAWGYSDSLHMILSSSSTIRNFAEAYCKLASEEHGRHPIPERLPTRGEIESMLGNVEMIKKSLENVRELQHNVETEKAREMGKHQRTFEDDDVSMYGDGMKQTYNMGEVKKRRGRAAPPGRCHSCNRIDTPEWRRGPDGARTLCNACGLHYAKLERKRQMEQRAIRPKAVE
jgi:hypothetical protein